MYLPLNYLITGASSGIGEEFARQIAQKGHNLILVARRLDRLLALKEELLRKYQIKIECYSCDLSKRNEVLEFIKILSNENVTIDGIINNAGFSVAREFHNTSLIEQLDFVETCVIAPMILCHEFIGKMRERNFGRIINVSSIVAFANGASGHSLYGAAKSFILKMSRSLSAENSDYNINILALCPGPTKSEFQIHNGMAQKLNKPHRIKPMSAQEVVFQALNANETKKEVLVNGIINKISVFALRFIPEWFLNPIIRNAARKMVIK